VSPKGFGKVEIASIYTGKNIGQYRQILQTLKRRILQETGHGWRPTRVICDYEYSLIAAVQTELSKLPSKSFLCTYTRKSLSAGNRRTKRLMLVAFLRQAIDGARQESFVTMSNRL
jgi:hypothetical protein